MMKGMEFSLDEFEPLSNPRLSFPHLQVDERDFIMKIYHVFSFRMRKENHVYMHPIENALI